MEPPTPPSGDLNVGDIDAQRDVAVTYNVYHQHPAPGPQPPPFAGVPALPAHGIVGRDAQLATLRARLMQGETLSLVALEGQGGVGKTTLAVALAYDAALRAHFADGLLWASLGKTPDVLGALAAWGEALGRDVTRYVNASERCQALRDAIGQRRMLLVVDDAWSTEAAQALRCGGPACAHLLTTRDRDIARAFAPAGVEAVPTLDEDKAWALLQTLAPAACQTDPAAAQALAHAVGGLPLALTLLGGYLGARNELADEARAALSDLHDPARRLALASQRLGSRDGQLVPLQAVIALSLDDLPAEVVRAFQSLAAFAPKPATFDRVAAEAVTEGDGATLTRLLRRNLLEREGEDFALHQVLHDFARPDLDPAATARHSAHYLALANADRHDWRRIDAAYPQLQWAWARLPDKAVLEYVWAVHQHQNRRGLWRDYITWASRGLTVAQQQGQRQDEGTLLTNIGSVYDKLGQRREALGYYERTLPISEAVGDRAGLAVTLTNIGSVYDKLGQRREALGYYERALPLMEEVGDRAGESVTRYNIAVLHRAEGRLAEAVAQLRRVVELDEQVEHPDLEADRATLARVEKEWAQQGKPWWRRWLGQ